MLSGVAVTVCFQEHIEFNCNCQVNLPPSLKVAYSS